MLIHDDKFNIINDSILQKFSQEPSMSSTYDCVLDALIMMLGILIHDVKFDNKDDPMLQNFGQEPQTSSKYDCVLDAFIIMLGS